MKQFTAEDFKNICDAIEGKGAVFPAAFAASQRPDCLQGMQHKVKSLFSNSFWKRKRTATREKSPFVLLQ